MHALLEKNPLHDFIPQKITVFFPSTSQCIYINTVDSHYLKLAYLE